MTDSYEAQRDAAAEAHWQSVYGEKTHSESFKAGSDWAREQAKVQAKADIAQLAAMCNEVVMLRIQVSGMETEIDHLTAELSESERESEELNDILSEETEKLRAEINRLIGELAELRLAYNERGEAMRHTGDMVRSLYAPKNVKLNKENGRLKGEIDRLTAENWVRRDSSLRTYDGLTEELDKLKQVTADLAAENAELREKLEKALANK